MDRLREILVRNCPTIDLDNATDLITGKSGS